MTLKTFNPSCVKSACESTGLQQLLAEQVFMAAGMPAPAAIPTHQTQLTHLGGRAGLQMHAEHSEVLGAATKRKCALADLCCPRQASRGWIRPGQIATSLCQCETMRLRKHHQRNTRAHATVVQSLQFCRKLMPKGAQHYENRRYFRRTGKAPAKKGTESRNVQVVQRRRQRQKRKISAGPCLAQLRDDDAEGGPVLRLWVKTGIGKRLQAPGHAARQIRPQLIISYCQRNLQAHSSNHYPYLLLVM